MRRFVGWFLVFCTLSIFAAQAQVRPPADREFQITKIDKNLVATPDYGIGQYRTSGASVARSGTLTGTPRLWQGYAGLMT